MSRARAWAKPVPWFHAALVAVVVLLAAELGLRAIDDHLPRETAGDTVEIELKYDQLRELAAEGEPVDLVVLGNSTLDAGFDPTVMAATSARFDAPFNAALLGCPLPAIRRWADDFVLAETDPDTVLLGLTPLDVPTVGIFGVSKPAVADAFDATFDRLQPTALQRADRSLSDRSVLLERREVFRSPGELWRGITATISGEDKQFAGAGPVTLEGGRRGVRDRATWEDELIAPRGGIRTYWGYTHDGEPRSLLSEGDRRAFETSRVDRLQLAGVIDTIREAGVEEIILVIPPHDRVTLEASGLPLDHFDRLARDLVSVGRDEGFPVIDMSGLEWDHSAFFDPAHLSKQGSQRFTEMLAVELDRL